MAGLFGQPSVEEILQQRRQERNRDLQGVIQRNAAQARTPSEQAGAGIGNFLGALGVRYFGNPGEVDRQSPEAQAALARQQAQEGLFAVPTEQGVSEGGQAQPLSQMEQLQAKSRQLKDYAQKFGSSEAFKLALQFDQQAMEMQQQQQEIEAVKQKRESFSRLSTNPKDNEAIQQAYKAGATPEEVKTITEYSGANPYAVVGNFVFNKDTGEFLQPEQAQKQLQKKYTVQRIGKDAYGVLDTTTGEVVKEYSSPTEAQEGAEGQAMVLGKLARLDQTLGVIDRAFDHIDGAGLEYSTLSRLPGPTESKRLFSTVKTIRANLAFDRLQQMREESKTGGALGQVSNIELGLLESTVEALEDLAGTSSEDLVIGLNNVKKHYNNFKNSLLGKAPNINWDDPAYANNVKVVDGVRYWADTNSGKVWKIGEVNE